MTSNIRRDGSIIVSVASYRDSQCSLTLSDCFRKAKNPSRVFIALVQQNSPTDTDCEAAADIPPQFKRNVRAIRLHHLEARGPTHARYLATTLVNNEEFFFQIDSHTRFVQDWDELAINDILKLENAGQQKVVLSTYPKAFDPDVRDGETDPDTFTVPHMCRAFFTENNHMISFDGSEALPPDPSGLPRQNAFVAGGLLFARTEMVREVPFDSLTPMLFVGEEILYSARLWTHGWNVFVPSTNLVFHYYSRENNPKFWDHTYKLTDKPATQKVRFLLQLDPNAKVEDYIADNLDRFGMGTERTIESFYQWTGIDFNTMTVTKNFCRLEDDYKNHDTLSWNATKNPIRKAIENFVGEEGQEPNFPAFQIVEGFMGENGQITFQAPTPPMDDIHNEHKRILVLWLIVATVCAWLWLAKRWAKS